jgi:hypothetical protein
LFRHWSVALLQEGGEWTRAKKLLRLCVGPRFHDVELDDGRGEFQLAGTAPLYLRLHSPGAERTRVVVQAEGAEALQVTLVRVPRARPRLTLHCEAGSAPGQVRLRLRATAGTVRIEAAAWEKLVPTGSGSDDTSFHDANDSGAWFADTTLGAGQTVVSRDIRLPHGARAAELVFRVLARDAAGNTLPAWASWCDNGNKP